MANNILEYKGYHTKVEFDADSSVLRGEIEGIRDYVDFESDSLADVEKEFHDAVDNYLDLCKRVGKEPDKEYRGVFSVRISPELHGQLVNIASRKGMSLNVTVEDAIARYVAV